MNSLCLEAFYDELMKLSASSDEESSDEEDVKVVKPKKDHSTAVGMAAGTGGAVAAKKSVPRITGRTTYRHGTSSRLADTIRSEGIRPANRTGVQGVIEQGGFPKEWADYGYVAKSPTKARAYAMQASRQHGGVPETLKVSLPEWKEGLQTITIENPETAGGFKAWKKRTLARLDDPKNIERTAKQMGFGTDDFGRLMAERQIKQVKTVLGGPLGKLMYRVQAYGGERAIPHVPAEYIRGSDKYVPHSLRELGQYIKARPGRFASGVGLGALGLAGIGYGAHRLFGGGEGDQ